MVRAIDDGYTNAGIGTLILEAQADAWAPSQWPNKETRAQVLLQGMREDGGDEARRAALELARELAVHGQPRDEWSEPARWWRGLVESLAADGWEFDTVMRRLVPTVPGIDVPSQTSALMTRLEALGWDIAGGHYDQAVDAIGRGNWAAGNAQLRSTLEDVVPRVVQRLCSRSSSNVQNGLQALQAAGHLVDGEQSFAKGLWQMCQTSGAHPGLSDSAEARFRLLCVTAYLLYVLDRLP